MGHGQGTHPTYHAIPNSPAHFLESLSWTNMHDPHSSTQNLACCDTSWTISGRNTLFLEDIHRRLESANYNDRIKPLP